MIGISTTVEPTDDELYDLIQPLWLKTKPSQSAQRIRSELSVDFDDPRLKQWAADFIPDYVWSLIDIAAQRGIDAARRETLEEVVKRTSAEIAVLALNAEFRALAKEPSHE